MKTCLPPEPNHPATLSFSAIFGNFYTHVFRVLPHTDFGFLHDVFEKFVIEDWKGLIQSASLLFGCWATELPLGSGRRLSESRARSVERSRTKEIEFLKEGLLPF